MSDSNGRYYIDPCTYVPNLLSEYTPKHTNTYMQTYIETHTHIHQLIQKHTQIHAHRHTHTPIYPLIHMHAHIDIHTQLHPHIHTHNHTGAHTHTHTYIDIHTHVRTYVHTAYTNLYRLLYNGHVYFLGVGEVFTQQNGRLREEDTECSQTNGRPHYLGRQTLRVYYPRDAVHGCAEGGVGWG